VSQGHPCAASAHKAGQQSLSFWRALFRRSAARRRRSGIRESRSPGSAAGVFRWVVAWHQRSRCRTSCASLEGVANEPESAASRPLTLEFRSANARTSTQIAAPTMTEVRRLWRGRNGPSISRSRKSSKRRGERWNALPNSSNGKRSITRTSLVSLVQCQRWHVARRPGAGGRFMCRLWPMFAIVRKFARPVQQVSDMSGISRSDADGARAARSPAAGFLVPGGCEPLQVHRAHECPALHARSQCEQIALRLRGLRVPASDGP
jgi:hypothetical protein